MRKAGKPLGIIRRKAIIDEIKNRIVSEPLKLPNNTDLAKEYGVSRITMIKLVDEAWLSIPIDSIEKTKNKFHKLFDGIEKKTLELLNNSNKYEPEEYRKNLDMLLRVIKEKTDYLERFHLKAKAKENIEVSVEKQLIIDNFNRVVDTEAKEK